jgi:hypothetical protein
MSSGIAKKSSSNKNDRRKTKGAKPLVLKLGQFIAQRFTVRIQHRRLPSIKPAKSRRAFGGLERRQSLNGRLKFSRRHLLCVFPLSRPVPYGSGRNGFRGRAKSGVEKPGVGLAVRARKSPAGRNGDSAPGGE